VRQVSVTQRATPHSLAVIVHARVLDGAHRAKELLCVQSREGGEQGGGRPMQFCTRGWWPASDVVLWGGGASCTTASTQQQGHSIRGSSTHPDILVGHFVVQV
jgi:hypothetical protein